MSKFAIQWEATVNKLDKVANSYSLKLISVPSPRFLQVPKKSCPWKNHPSLFGHRGDRAFSGSPEGLRDLLGSFIVPKKNGDVRVILDFR